MIKVHPTAEVHPDAKIGDGTKIWNHAQVRERAVLGKNCILSKNVYVDLDVKIGNNVKLQNNVSVYKGVTIEDDVFVGPNAVFTNDLYPRALIWEESRLQTTLVKKGASIGAGAIIICGKRIIGEHAMVGSGAVVTKNVPAHGLVLGNPARLVGFVCTCGYRLHEKTKQQHSYLMHCAACKKEIDIPLTDYSLLKK